MASLAYERETCGDAGVGESLSRKSTRVDDIARVRVSTIDPVDGDFKF